MATPAACGRVCVCTLPLQTQWSDACLALAAGAGCTPPWRSLWNEGGLTMRVGKQALVILLVLTSLLGGGLLGCTFKSIEPGFVQAPPRKYTIVALGDVVVEDKLWEHLGGHFRAAVAKRLAEEKLFESIQDPAPATLSDSAVLVVGKITEVDKGSTALRWIIGFGAGKARVGGAFEFRDAGGRTLVKFSGTESYSGGAGIGGAGFLDMEDLMRRFGETMAERIIAWSKGEKID